jgi:hypothetical protein
VAVLVPTREEQRATPMVLQVAFSFRDRTYESRWWRFFLIWYMRIHVHDAVLFHFSIFYAVVHFLGVGAGGGMFCAKYVNLLLSRLDDVVCCLLCQ